MSGLGVIFQRDGRPVERGSIEKIARSLKMYGPHRQLIRPMGSIAFAYTHFVNTPEALYDQQPVAGGDGRFTLVFDGRLDNREQLAERIGVEAKDLAQLPDSVLAMRSWEKWQTDALNEWIGEFAIIVWDKSLRRLIAAKEQFGRRGLHYHLRGDRLVIATMPKGIHCLGDIPREIDEQKIADSLVWMTGEPWRGFYKHIKRVPPAHYLLVEAEKSRLVEYYRLEDSVKETVYPSDDQYVEAAREHLQRSVKSALRSPGGVGAFMSGGLDSSTVAVTASKMLQAKGQVLPTFTWVPEPGWDEVVGPRYYGDETPYVKAIAQMHPNIELNLVTAEGKSFDYRQEEMFSIVEEPCNGLNNALVLNSLEQAQGKGIQTILDGQWGNATFSNTGQSIYIDLLESGQYRQLLTELLAISPGPLKFLQALRSRAIEPKIRKILTAERTSKKGSKEDFTTKSFINRRFAREMRTNGRYLEFGYAHHQKNYDVDRHSTSIFNLINYGAPDLGSTAYLWNVVHNIETRDPFANRALAEWSFGLPSTQFRRGGVARWLIRRMMAGQLPAIVLNNSKFGLQSADWQKRLTSSKDVLENLVDVLSSDPAIAKMLNADDLKLAATTLSEPTQLSPELQNRHLSTALPLALGLGSFTRWVSNANR